MELYQDCDPEIANICKQMPPNYHRHQVAPSDIKRRTSGSYQPSPDKKRHKKQEMALDWPHTPERRKWHHQKSTRLESTGKPTQGEAKRNLETYNRTRDRKRREIMVSDKSASQKQSTMEEVCSCPMFLQGITGNKSSKSIKTAHYVDFFWLIFKRL